MRKPNPDTVHRIREIMGLNDMPLNKNYALVEALAIDREEVAESARILGQAESYEQGRVAGAAEGRKSAIKEIKLKYRLVPKDRQQYLQELKKRIEEGAAKDGRL